MDQRHDKTFQEHLGKNPGRHPKEAVSLGTRIFIGKDSVLPAPGWLDPLGLRPQRGFRRFK